MRVWIFVLAFIVVFGGTVIPAEANGTSVSKRTKYIADVRVDPKKQQVSGSVELQFWPKDPKHVYLHLYPYAFTEKHKGEKWDELLGKEATLGTYAITKLSVQGKQAAIKRKGTVLEVPLGERYDGPVKVELQFKMKLPHNDGRMSYDEHAMWLGNWLPILAVYDKKGWHLDPYDPVGDPFYSEAADYQVQVTLPDGYQLASTATDRAAVMDASVSGKKKFLLKAVGVRDYALVIMDSSYRNAETKVGNTVVRTWWRETDDAEQARRVHDAAAQALAYFSSQFGTYPYTEFDVVRTGGMINGMEYPALVLLDGRHFVSASLGAISTAVHETAHQWFYGIVGNNQVLEAWLDEGFTEYASLAFLTAKYPELGAELVERRLEKGLNVPAYAQKQLQPWQSLSAFPDNQSYSDLVYSRTASMLWLLREAWGEKRLHEVLGRYVAQYNLGIADGEAWKATLSREAGEDAGDFLRYWLYIDWSKKDQSIAWLERQRQKNKAKQ